MVFVLPKDDAYLTDARFVIEAKILKRLLVCFAEVVGPHLEIGLYFSIDWETIDGDVFVKLINQL